MNSTSRGRDARARRGADRITAHRTAPHQATTRAEARDHSVAPADLRAVDVTEASPAVAAASVATPGAASRAPRRLGRRPVLDGLRGIAVLLVIAEHSKLIKNGFMGVDVFFVLSGFLISTLLFEEWERLGHISLKDFYKRRARRLLPAITLLAILAIATDLFAYQLTGWGIGLKLVSTFGFANNWVVGLSLDNGNALGAINPTWSLAQEEQFYLLWPVALILLLKLRVKPVQMLGLLAAAVAALLFAEPALAGHLSNYSDYYDPIDRGAELLLGCGASILWRWRMVWLPEGPTGARGEDAGAARLSPVVSVLTNALLLALTCAFIWLLLVADPKDSRWVFLGAAGLALPLLLLLIQVPRSLLGRVVSVRPLRWIGTVSYCLYLVHLLLRNVFVHFFPTLTNPWLVAAVTLASGLAVAALSLRYIETPIRQGRFLPLLALKRLGSSVAQAVNSVTYGPAAKRASHAARSPIRSSA